jgi:hypothetical protein
VAEGATGPAIAWSDAGLTVTSRPLRSCFNVLVAEVPSQTVRDRGVEPEEQLGLNKLEFDDLEFTAFGSQRVDPGIRRRYFYAVERRARQGGELLGELCSLGASAEFRLHAPVAGGGRLLDRQQRHARDRNNR